MAYAAGRPARHARAASVVNVPAARRVRRAQKVAAAVETGLAVLAEAAQQPWRVPRRQRQTPRKVSLAAMWPLPVATVHVSAGVRGQGKLWHRQLKRLGWVFNRVHQISQRRPHKALDQPRVRRAGMTARVGAIALRPARMATVRMAQSRIENGVRSGRRRQRLARLIASRAKISHATMRPARTNRVATPANSRAHVRRASVKIVRARMLSKAGTRRTSALPIMFLHSCGGRCARPDVGVFRALSRPNTLRILRCGVRKAPSAATEGAT